MHSIYHFRNHVAAALFALGVVSPSGLPYSRSDINVAADLVYEAGLNGGPIDIAAVHTLLAFDA